MTIAPITSAIPAMPPTATPEIFALLDQGLLSGLVVGFGTGVGVEVAASDVDEVLGVVEVCGSIDRAGDELGELEPG